MISPLKRITSTTILRSSFCITFAFSLIFERQLSSAFNVCGSHPHRNPCLSHSGLNFSSSEHNEDSSDGAVIEENFSGTINPLRLAVLKLGMTELRFTSPLNSEKRVGFYICANCGAQLFDSEGKYDSGTGWPSFWKTAKNGSVALKSEWDGRIECSCQRCGGHLGHVFPDGPQRKDVPEIGLSTIPDSDPKTGDANNKFSRLPRFCMNGASLFFTPKE